MPDSSDEEIKKIRAELDRINRNLEDVILPLLNHILKTDIKLNPEKMDAIKDLVGRISKQ